MKRRRERIRMEKMKMKSEIRSAIEELSLMLVFQHKGDDNNTDKHADAAAADSGNQAQLQLHQTTCVQIPTKPFISLCNLVLQVLDKIGPTMAVLRQDIHHNIQRLEMLAESNPSIYSDIVEVLKEEAKENKAKKGPSRSKAFVWLTRSLDFTVNLLKLVVEDFERNMEEAVEESYNTTLKPWHGWISSAAYKVALKLVPDSKSFVDILKAKDEDYDKLKEEMRTLISSLVPVLEQNHDIMRIYNLDKLKST